MKLPVPVALAESVESLPVGDAWAYEPKFDGHRLVVARDAAGARARAGAMDKPAGGLSPAPLAPPPPLDPPPCLTPPPPLNPPPRPPIPRHRMQRLHVCRFEEASASRQGGDVLVRQ